MRLAQRAALALALLLGAGGALAQQTPGAGVQSLAGMRGNISAPQARNAIGAYACPGCAKLSDLLPPLVAAVPTASLADIETSIPDAPSGPITQAYRTGVVQAGGALATFIQSHYGLSSGQMTSVMTAAGALVPTAPLGAPAAASGPNADITSLGALAGPLVISGGGTLPGVSPTLVPLSFKLGAAMPASVLVPTLNYQGSTGTVGTLAVLGSMTAPSLTHDATAIWQKVSGATTAGNNAATYTAIIKTTSVTGANASAAVIAAEDVAGGSGTYTEGLDARCILRSNGGTAGGGTCGNVALYATDAGITAFGNLIGLEGGGYDNTGTDQPTFPSFNPNHEVTAFLASNFGPSKADAGFVVSANNGAPFRTGFLALGSGVGSGAGVDDTGFATRGSMPVGLNLAGPYGLAAILGPGFSLDPGGNVYSNSLNTNGTAAVGLNIGGTLSTAAILSPGFSVTPIGVVYGSVAATGAPYVETFSDDLQRKGLSPQMFGAKGDGATDDTTALRNWANAARPGTTLTCPAATYVFKGTITFPPNLSHVSVKCNTAVFLYEGSATTIPLFVAGSTVNGCSDTDWVFEDFSIKSTTTMTAGDAFQLNDLCASEVRNVSAGKNLNGDGTLWNGLHFNGGNTVHYKGSGASAQSAALVVNGDTTTQFTDFWLDGGAFLGSNVGILIAGNVGGFEGVAADILENHENVRIDQSVVALPNLQVFFGPNVAIDITNGSTSGSYDVEVADPGGSNSFLFFTGTWIASAQNSCIVVDPGTIWNVNMSGGNLGNCQGSGYYQNSASVTANFVGTYMWGDQNYALDNAAGTLAKCAVRFNGNNPGNTFGTVGSSC